MRNIELREITERYLDENGLSVRFMSRRTGINRTTLQLWINGNKEINNKKLLKVKEFLSGSYIKNTETIIKELVNERKDINDSE